MDEINQRTVPTAVSSIPVQTLMAEVTAGPDQGQACVARGESLSIGTADGNDLVLTDSTVSRFHVVLSADAKGVRVVDHGSTNGTKVGAARIERGLVPPGTVLSIGRTEVSVGDGGKVDVEIHASDALARLRGQTPAMRRLMAKVRRLAPTEVSVLLMGETGTGKELVAEALHEVGSRRDGPFVTVDCGALTPTLVASELFGHERGAFTGATRQRIGAFERAHGGTVFLDEISELPANLQATLLGVLERRRFKRVGGDEDISIDVRVVSATHNDLRAAVNKNTFRLDLYYRIAGVLLEVPPLRERTADIPLLIEHFLRDGGYQGAVYAFVPESIMTALAAHQWTGNVRELRNWVEAAVAMGEAVEPPALAGAAATEVATDVIAQVLESTYGEARKYILREFERRYLTRLLERSNHNVSAASRIGHMDRSNLIRLLNRHRIR